MVEVIDFIYGSLRVNQQMAWDLIKAINGAETTEQLKDNFFKKYGYVNITKEMLQAILDNKAKIATAVRAMWYLDFAPI